MLPCNSSLYHYNGLCFNKGRVPQGEVAIPETDCLAIDKKEEHVTTIIQ